MVSSAMVVVKACLAEFIGTLIVTLTVCCNVWRGQSMWASASIACSLMVATYAFAPISGAVFNPAVSLALCLSRRMSWERASVYSAIQIIAGTVAAFTSRILYQNYTPAHEKSFELWQWGLCELIYTFMLCFVVLNATEAAEKNGAQFYGISIGLVILAGAYGAGAVSHGCFNPAVALAIELGRLDHVSSPSTLVSTMAAIGFELVGAVVASALFRIVRPMRSGLEEVKSAVVEVAARLTSEFLGTYLLVLTMGLNVLGNSPASAFSVGASLACMIFVLADVSGAHFNPAVTFSILCIGGIEKEKAGLYVVAQLFGGILAACTYFGIYGKSFPLGPATGYNFGEVAQAEVFLTFVLCFVVLSTVFSPYKEHSENMSQYSGLAIGSTMMAGGFAVGAISGGYVSLNPAVSYGIAFSNALDGTHVWGIFKEAPIYTVFEFTGGVAAAGLYILTHGPKVAMGKPPVEEVIVDVPYDYLE